MIQKNYEVYYYAFGSLICVKFNDDLNKLSIRDLRDYTIARTILLAQSSDYIFTKNGQVIKNRSPKLDEINNILENDCKPLTKYISINDDYKSFEKLFVQICHNNGSWRRKMIDEAV